jgi:regulatory protein
VTPQTSADGREATAAAVAFVLRSTRARPQTAAELRAKLSDRAYDTAVVDAAIARATELGAIDDAAFARAWVADRGMVRGYSAARLREELRRRKVPQPLIDDALAQLDDRDDVGVATDLARTRAQRMPATLAPEAVARRLLGFLARRGYSEAVARRVAIDVSGLDRQWD